MNEVRNISGVTKIYSPPRVVPVAEEAGQNPGFSLDLTVTDSNPDAPDDYGELEVNGCLRIDDQISDVLVPQPDEGATLSSMRGILTFSYGHHKLLPGGAEDVTW